MFADTKLESASTKWIKALSAQGSTWRATAVLLSNDDLLVLGSDQRISDDDVKLYIYDTKTLKWSGAEIHGPSPKESSYYSSELSENLDKVFIFWFKKDILTISILDLATNMQWRELESFGNIPNVSQGYTTTRIGTLIYFFGGVTTDGKFSNELYIFNTETNEWKKIEVQGEKPIPRSGHSSTLISDDKLFIFGGENQNNCLNDGYVFNTKLNQFEQLNFFGEIPSPRTFHSASFIHINERPLVVVFGGRSLPLYSSNPTISDEFNSVFIYDIFSSCWIQSIPIGEAPSGRHSLFSGSLNSQLIFFGGEDGVDVYFDIYFLKLHEIVLIKNDIKFKAEILNNEDIGQTERPHEPSHQQPVGRPSNLFVDTSRNNQSDNLNHETYNNINNIEYTEDKNNTQNSTPKRPQLNKNLSTASLFTNKHIISMLENSPSTPTDEKKSGESFPKSSYRSRRNSIVSPVNSSPSRRMSISGRPSPPRSSTPINFYGDKTPPRSGTPTSVLEDDEEQAAQLQETFSDLSKFVAHKKIFLHSQDEEESVDPGSELEFNVNFGSFNFGSESNQLSSSLAEFCKTESEIIQQIFKYISKSNQSEDSESHDENDLLHVSVFLFLCKHCFILENGISISIIVTILQEILGEDEKTLVNDSMQLDIFRKLLLRISVKKYGNQFDSSIACFQQLVNRNLLPFFKDILNEDPQHDPIFSGESVSLMREYDTKLKELFMLYATLGLSSAHQPTWEFIVTNHAAVSIPEFLQFAHNFDIVPYLIPRHIFIKIIQSASLRGFTSIKNTENGFNFPEFVEGIFRIAIHIYSKYPYSTMLKSTKEKIHALLSSIGFDDKKIFNLFVKSSGVSVRNKYKYKSIVKKQQYDLIELIQDPDSLRSELAHIFMYYCAFGDPLNLEHMSSAKFTKFVKDIQIDKFVNKEAADLIYVKLMKNRELRVGNVSQNHFRMTFPYFMEALKVISTRVSPKLEPQEALYELLKNHIFPFASKEPRKFEHVNALESKTQELFSKYKKQIMALFQSYCTKDTIDSHNFGYMTIDSFSKLAVQFDITPTLVAKKDLYRIFRSSLLNSTVEDIDYQQFEECIAKVAYLGYSKHPYDIKYKTLDQKVYAIFEKIGLFDWTTFKKILEKFGHKVSNSPIKQAKINSSNLQINEEFAELPPESELDFELRCIFAYYSEYGNRFGKQQLGIQQYNRFCKDCQLYDSVFSQADADLVYIEITKNDQQKLTYELFCDSLTFLSERKYYNISTIDGLRRLLLQNVLPLAQRKQIKEIAEHEPVEPEILEVLQTNEVPLLKIFDTYRKLEMIKGASPHEVAANDSTLSLVELLRFTQDFDICPVLLSVSEVSDLFRITSHQNNFEEGDNELDFNLFLDCLSRIASRAYGKNHFNSIFTSNAQKAEALMDRMDITSAIRLTNKLRSIKVHSVVSEK